MAQKVKNLQCRSLRTSRFDPWIRKILGRKKWQPTPVFLPGKSHGQRSLSESIGSQSQTWLSAWHINKNNWQLGILKQDFQWPHREMYMVKKIRHSSVFCDFYDPLWFFSNVLLLFFFSLKVSFACRSSSKLHQDTIFDLRSVNYLLIQRMQNPYWKRWKEARNSMSSLTVAMKWQQAFWNR